MDTLGSSRSENGLRSGAGSAAGTAHWWARGGAQCPFGSGTQPRGRAVSSSHRARRAPARASPPLLRGAGSEELLSPHGGLHSRWQQRGETPECVGHSLPEPRVQEHLTHESLCTRPQRGRASAGRHSAWQVGHGPAWKGVTENVPRDGHPHPLWGGGYLMVCNGQNTLK